MRVELYAGNLHHGGAVVVAATFFDQLPLLWRTEAMSWIDHLTVVASPRVARDMVNLSAFEALDRVEVVLSEDRPQLRSGLRRDRSTDVRFTVFGPAYVGRQAPIEVLGFADGSILPGYEDVNPTKIDNHRALSRLVGGLKRRWKLALLKQSDVYVVQTRQMAAALNQLVPDRRIEVVPNIVPAAFHGNALQRSFPLPERLPGEVRLFYPARGYQHKNHVFIPSVCHAFERAFGVQLRVVITLRQDEVQALGLAADPHVINVGEVSVADCPSLYEQTDGLLFPSLNETSSSSPMEALFMGKPVFVPDLPFMKTMTNGYACFYVAGDSGSAADAIHNGVERYGRLTPEIVQGVAWARALPKPLEQARAYLSLLRDVADVRTSND